MYKKNPIFQANKVISVKKRMLPFWFTKGAFFFFVKCTLYPFRIKHAPLLDHTPAIFITVSSHNYSFYSKITSTLEWMPVKIH